MRLLSDVGIARDILVAVAKDIATGICDDSKERRPPTLGGAKLARPPGGGERNKK